MDTHATIKVLLETVFSLRPMQTVRRKKIRRLEPENDCAAEDQ
jgi:hypothetical protein